MALTDDQLTKTGLPPKGVGRVLVLACGALAREVLAVFEANGLDHVDLHCLPAIYHVRPEKIVPAVRKAVAEASGYDSIFLAYADCGTGGLLAAAAEELGVEMLQGPHCYAFYEGTEAFAARGEVTSFYLTDFLVRQFDAFVWSPLGLDKHPELRDAYFGNYETLVYQSQSDDAALVDKARACADRLGLAFEHRRTGYGDLGTAISRL